MAIHGNTWLYLAIHGKTWPLYMAIHGYTWLYLVISEKDPVTLNNTLNSELNKLSAWFAANKLSLNISKTKFMVFRPRQKRLCYDYDISITGEALTQVSEALFLGVLLDHCLSWKSYISLVAHKISKSIGIIYRSSYFLFKTALRTLYNSLVLPYLYYCNLVWGSTYKSNLKRLTILQKPGDKNSKQVRL